MEPIRTRVDPANPEVARHSTARGSGFSHSEEAENTNHKPTPSVDAPAGQANAPIIVTARRAEELLSEIAISIAALGADSIEKLSITNLDDLTNFTPGLS